MLLEDVVVVLVVVATVVDVLEVLVEVEVVVLVVVNVLVVVVVGSDEKVLGPLFFTFIVPTFVKLVGVLHDGTEQYASQT